MVTLDKVKRYLRIDGNDDDVMLVQLIQVAHSYMTAAIGEKYNQDDGRAEMLSLIVIQDLYDQRGMTEKVSGNVRKLVSDFSLQLRLETDGD